MKLLSGVLILPLFVLCFGCSSKPSNQPAVKATATEPDPLASLVTADIQAGIERHIAAQTDAGGGFFRLHHDGKELKLRLVRVHTEYLANLGPDSHFACVDLVHEDGQVYDVDFFLNGDAGSMTVTTTTVHKLNGQPYYSWEKTPEGGWRTVAVDESDDRLLGVITDTDRFDFIYRATLPEFNRPARMWLPLPASDDHQTVDVSSIQAPGRQRILTDATYSNRVLYLELDPADAGAVVEMRFAVQRREKSVYAESGGDVSAFLNPERLVPEDPKFTQIAGDVLRGKEGELVRARALYDHVIDQMQYMKYGEGWGQGDALYACDVKTGNCTDFHAYFIALARAAGIPARFAIGAAIPSERDEGGIDGYHCWAEFHAEGRWWPVDISEANKYSRLATYYFGRHPANRIELSRGRDLVVDPGPQSGPINFLAYPVLEVDGQPAKAKVQFAFVRK
jgi:transglutaminase-like putative cysteine protease